MRCSRRLASWKYGFSFPASRSSFCRPTVSRPSGPISSPRWSAAGVTTRSAGRVQDAAQFGAVARGKDVQRENGGRVGYRQPAPCVAADGPDSRMGTGGLAQGELRDVQSQPVTSGQLAENGREVVAGTRADVGHAARAVGGTCRVAGRLGNSGGHAREMTGCQETGPGLHHRRRVAAAAGPGGKQAHIALPRDVERVPGRAAQRRAVAHHGVAAVGARQVPDHRAEHAPILACPAQRAMPEIRSAPPRDGRAGSLPARASATPASQLEYVFEGWPMLCS